MESYRLAELIDPALARPVALPIKFPLNTLRQVRGGMERADLAELAESIRARGQLEPGLVAVLTPNEAQAYLVDINDLWGTAYTLKDMQACTLDGTCYYCFVVFGHRRLLACRLAEQLQKAEPLEGAQFDNRFRCTLHFGLQLQEAILMQLNENTYQKPPLQDELRGLWRTWRLMSRKNHRLTKASFARTVGVSADKVRQALLFAELPESIQRFADPGNQAGTLPCGFLVELARLAEAQVHHGRPLGEAELWAAALYLVVKQTKLSAFRAEVSARIAVLEHQQGSLFEPEEISPPQSKVRRVAEAQSLHAYLGLVAYLRRIIELDREGVFGTMSPPVSTAVVAEFSPHSPARMLQRMACILSELAPRLIELVAAERRSTRALEADLVAVPDVQAALDQLLAGEEL